MTDSFVLTDPNEITPAWLTGVLLSDGALVQGEVAGVDLEVSERELSTIVRLTLSYTDDAQGDRPARLLLKMVTLDLEDDFFGPSEVHYYRRDYAGGGGLPIPRTYNAIYSEAQGRYHILMADLSETHVTARGRLVTLDYGRALAEGLADLHAHWWGSARLAEIDACLPDEQAIRQFANMGRNGAELIIDACADELKPGWPQIIRRVYAEHPRILVSRTHDDTGFTLIHGDVNPGNILIPVDAVRPLYLIDRQPFNWSLTVWLGVYDLAYALALYWETDQRRALEETVLRQYRKRLADQGVQNYSWEQIWDDYRLCVMMGVYVATEWCRSELHWDTHPYWMPMLKRTLHAIDDLDCLSLLP